MATFTPITKNIGQAGYTDEVRDALNQLSLLDETGLVWKGEFTPTGVQEYPSTPSFGWAYTIELTSDYTFTAGDLIGQTVSNGQIIAYSTAWVIGSINTYSKSALDGGQLDTRYYTEAEIDANIYDAAELDAGQLDTRYYTEAEIDANIYDATELDAGQLDNRYYTEAETDTAVANRRKTYAPEHTTITPTADADYTLTAGENLYGKLNLADGSWLSAHNIIVDTSKREITVDNSAGTYDATVKTSAGTGISVPTGIKAYLYCDGTNVVLDENRTLLLETEVTGSDTTQVDFTGLDINVHKSYRLEIDAIAGSGGAASWGLYYNGDTTATNYHEQSLLVSAGVLTGSRSNNADILYTSSRSSATIEIKRTNGYANANSDTNRGIGATIEHQTFSHTKSNATVTNITSLSIIAGVANSIGIGTKFRLYRGDV